MFRGFDRFREKNFVKKERIKIESLSSFPFP